MINGSIGPLSGSSIYIIAVMAALILILYVVTIVLMVKLSNMKKRYKIMMSGTNADNVEHMLLEHITKVEKVMQQNASINAENKRIQELLEGAIQRVGIVRFAAFEDVGGDLSYAVALLDRKNTGVILSSIFSRNSSTTYMKPIDKGHSSYKLSDEEQDALNKAMMQR